MVRLCAAMMVWVLISAACGTPCRTDNDCETAGGVERCVAETGLCEPLPTRPPPACAADGDCLDGRSCIDSACTFIPQCQRFTAAQDLNFAGTCDGVDVSGAATLSSVGCDSSLSLDGVGELDIGALDTTVITPLAIAACTDALYDGANGIIGLAGCDIGASIDCDLSLSVRPLETACVVGAGPVCDVECGALAAIGTLSVGRCE